MVDVKQKERETDPNPKPGAATASAQNRKLSSTVTPLNIGTIFPKYDRS
jgi:hypothetical protein